MIYVVVLNGSQPSDNRDPMKWEIFVKFVKFVIAGVS
jgi:hypothetical protein